jgi:AraC family transcriptional regulator
MRSEHAVLPPHADPAGPPTTTRPYQVGVSFSGHRDLVHATGGRTVRADVPPGSAVVSGPERIDWLRVREPTEALEVYPDPGLVRAAAGGWPALDQRVGVPDATVLGIGSVLRRAHAGTLVLGDVAASTLAHRLVTHLVGRYGGVRLAVGPGLLPAAVVDRVGELVEARLGEVLTLDELAAVAHLSPWHFARGFARTTGLPPHRFVTARRMDRARLLLRTSDRPVEEVARAVGFANLSHFRRVFRAHHGAPPTAVRPAPAGGAGRIGELS